MYKLFLSFLFIFFLCTTAASAQNTSPFSPQDAHYLWPTDASPYMTSTFGETRAGHFHAALDIKTWGRRGYNVFATRDGIVYRIAIGPHGYGKVIYLKHADGSFSVYAHLLAFNNQLQELADSIRFAEDYQFKIDRLIEDKNLKVKQGEVIGYSGASGIGPPHLHFELRTPSEKPFNPLLTNLSVPDNIAPGISAISVEPLTPSSTVARKHSVYTRRARRSKGQYKFGTIVVSGPVGLGINVFDHANRVRNTYAAYELSMQVDGKLFFKARADSFSYNETHQMLIDRVYPLLKRYGKGYQRLYVADGNSLSFYQTGKNNGKLNLRPGKHSISIHATDYFGNTSTALLNLIVYKRNINHADPIKKNAGQADASFLPPHKWQWFKNSVTIPSSTFRQLTIASTDSAAFIRDGKNIIMDMRALDNLFINIPGTGPLTFQRIIPDSVGLISTVDHEAFAIFPRHTFYDTVSAALTVTTFKPDSVKLEVIPDAYPLQNDYTFYVKKDTTLNNTSKLSFYKWSRKYHKWYPVPTQFTRNYLIGKTDSFGTFVSLRDTIPPVLDNPRLKSRPDGQWLVMINVKDNLSGIDYDRTKISVDGIRGIAEYEPEDNRFVYYHPGFKPTKATEIEVVGYDNMGNKATRTFNLP